MGQSNTGIIYFLTNNSCLLQEMILNENSPMEKLLPDSAHEYVSLTDIDEV